MIDLRNARAMGHVLLCYDRRTMPPDRQLCFELAKASTMNPGRRREYLEAARVIAADVTARGGWQTPAEAAAASWLLWEPENPA